MKIDLGDVAINYEKSGAGPPIILLHGNGEDHLIFDTLTQLLSKNMTVYALDSRGHGGSDPVDEYHYRDMANDVSSFIERMNIVNPALIGFSDGGIVGLMIASEHPDLLSRLVVCGPNLNPKDIRSLPLLSMRISYLLKRDPLVKLMLTEPDISDEELQRITIPTLILFGEKDIVPKTVATQIGKDIPDSTVYIVPGADHSSYVLDNVQLYNIVKDFLKI